MRYNMQTQIDNSQADLKSQKRSIILMTSSAITAMEHTLTISGYFTTKDESCVVGKREFQLYALNVLVSFEEWNLLSEYV